MQFVVYFFKKNGGVKMRIEEIKEMVKSNAKMSCLPNFKRLPNNYITDEDKSVKWNIEQVKRNHLEYNEEVKRLQKIKTTDFNKIRDVLIEYICDKLKIKYNRKIGLIIINESNRNNFDNTIDEFFNKIEENINFVYDILNELNVDKRQ